MLLPRSIVYLFRSVPLFPSVTKYPEKNMWKKGVEQQTSQLANQAVNQLRSHLLTMPVILQVILLSVLLSI